jgi:hypothetical protein
LRKSISGHIMPAVFGRRKDVIFPDLPVVLLIILGGIQ